MRALVFTVSFVLAFLLFSVQPMATKMVLPTLGGSPAVWNTVMFTFQLLLLAGYMYAHIMTRHVPSRYQVPFHAALVIASCFLLPLMVVIETSDILLDTPIRHLVAAFLLQLGLPFFCLSATAPLLQSWVSRSGHSLAKTPYVLYSASNFGSFAGLLGYIALVEPGLDLSQQRHYWSVMFVLGMGALLYAGWRLKFGDIVKPSTVASNSPRLKTRLGWVWLAFLPSSLSLGVTTYIATDIASIPLLWVIPLSLYLLSFVDAFRTRPMIVTICQRIAPTFGLCALLVYGMGGNGIAITYVLQIVTFAMLAFALHGWLAMRQPEAHYLTQFYVCLSIGGLLGGVLNGLIAPLMLREAFEYPIVLLLASITGFILLRVSENTSVGASKHLRVFMEVMALLWVLTLAVYVALTWMAGEGFSAINSFHVIKAALIASVPTAVIFRSYVRIYYTGASVAVIMLFAITNGTAGFTTLFKDRNFFGVSRVYENAATNVRYFMHDTTLHGLQSGDSKLATTTLAYYSVVKDIFRALPVAKKHPLAVVGLGIGTLKCLAVKGQKVDLYEINPMVRDIAQNADYFTYMRDCSGDQRILMGDGRLRLAEQPDGYYGVIIIDVFSSDAIPAHLLTQEAFAMYMRKLAPGGVLVMNTTNRHIDLWPLIGVQSKALGHVAYGKFFSAPKDNPLVFNCYWVVMARSRDDIATIVGKQADWHELIDEGGRAWTDDYSNILPYFKALR